MIINDEREFVFVEVPRTGTTAISLELREQYGCYRWPGRKHATLEEACAAQPRLRGYRLFAGKRNPLDSEVSLYFKFRNNHRGWYTNEDLFASNGGWIDEATLERFRFVQETDASFADYFRRFGRGVRSIEWRHDQRRAEYLSPFEDLQTGFSTIVRAVGFEQLRPLPETNTTDGRGRDFLEHYTPDIRNQAMQVFGPLMVDLGYEFPTEWGDLQPSLLSRAAYAVDGFSRAPSTPGLLKRALRRPSGTLRRGAVRIGASQ